ncbi:MAG: DUF1549 domain-containing protein [Gemmataceae bacterium]
MPALRISLPLCLLAVLSGFAAAPPGTTPVSRTPLHARIDQFFAAQPTFARIPARQSSDAEFLRRIYLDLTGCIPPAGEARRFLADPNPNKRVALIDQLLASPEHARHLATFLDITLMERRPEKGVPHAEWKEFLRQSVEANLPWDALVREILSGDGSDPKKRHRIKFFLDRGGEINELTRDMSRLFLGTNLQCAQCHDHPRIEDYRQEDYYGLAAFLCRTTVVNNQLGEKADGETSFQSVFDPKKTTRSSPPRVPGGKAITDPPVEKSKAYKVPPKDGVVSVPTYSRKSQLANALASPANPAFRRNIANRLWALMMGKGLVDPLDMDHGANPPSYPELLDLLAGDIAARRFDMRSFLREIARSEVYQRSSELPENVEARKLPVHAVAILKPLTPEQLAMSLMQATGFTDVHRQALGPKVTEASLHARLAGNIGPFIQSFGSNPGTAQSFEARMDQALFLANGSLIRSWLSPQPGNRIGRLQKLSGAAQVDELFLGILTRLPDADERRDALEFLSRHPASLPDLAWALLTSTEFRFNH